MAKRKRTFYETDVDEILRNKKSNCTMYQEHSALRSLQDFVKCKEMDVDFNLISEEKLDLLLRDIFLFFKEWNRILQTKYLSLCLPSSMSTFQIPQITIV